MLRTRWRRAVALAALTLTLMAGMPCLCVAHAFQPQTTAHACCAQSTRRAPVSQSAVAASRPSCAHCAGSHVAAIGASLVSPNAAAPLSYVAGDLPAAAFVPGIAVDALARHRQPPGNGTRLCVVLRALLL